ncbi:WXG100 family type VII secretion target [Virgisporangium aurantiacum]|uniref:PPE family protein n=1 Tax=Virgisporangium aurantiacum TaxID=175570 RepID=A0A8J3Z6N0_9ACTN|nr:hypothetical protein [Virgisporangium aurantiacum]GIJ55883.1 hypothetical protein Vau01_033990 [Virgisporangium aurantiacum]
MPDEYYQRYNRYSHDELYRQLLHGSPAVLSRQADAWRRAGATAATLSTRLRRDLTGLAARWTGEGSDEFASRIGLIATYAQELADEAASIGVGAEAMSRALAEAQRQAQPNPVGPNPAVPVAAGADSVAVRAALLSAATGWSTPEAVLGSSLGHVPTAEERSAAHERMVTLVAELAALYGVVDQANWPAAIPDAPAGMPGAVVNVPEEPGRVADGAATGGLAGVSDLGMRGPAGQVPGVAGLAFAAGAVPGGPIGGPVPAAMLSGAAPGLAGAAKGSVGTVPPGGAAAGAASAAAAGGAMPMMMAGAGVIGHQPGGGAGTGAGVEEGADWWTGNGAAWVTAGEGGAEPPEAVVNGSDPPSGSPSGSSSG